MVEIKNPDSFLKFSFGLVIAFLLSRTVGDFYGTRIEIWAGFGPVQQLLRPFFHVFMGKKISLKHCGW